MLDPHDGDLLPPRLRDEGADVRDDGVALVGSLDDALLHVDHEQRGVGAMVERRHAPGKVNSLDTAGERLYSSLRTMPGRPISTRRRAEATRDVELTLTEYAILGLLGHLDEPISGYDLRKVVDRSIGFIWQPSKTQLYAVLRRLVGRGLASERRVRQRRRPDKTLFAVTPAGRACVHTWLSRDENQPDPDRSVLVLKLFFGAQADGDALVRQLVAFRDAYAARLSLYESKWRDDSPEERAATDRFTRMTLRYGIARARAAVRWANATLEELQG